MATTPEESLLSRAAANMRQTSTAINPEQPNTTNHILRKPAHHGGVPKNGISNSLNKALCSKD